MKVYSVSEITREIRALLEGHLSEVWMEGEISNFRPAHSGHFYFSLKDANALLRAVMFRGVNLQLRFQPENGLHVLCYGRVTVYEPRGEYQIILEHMEPKGVGALQLAFEQLKKKLEAEGLFDPKRKRSLPSLPHKIGIITSPTGAVIRDMIQILTRRFPPIQILLNPVAVQGEGAAVEIAQAIGEVNQREDVDLLIVGRGGGSIEDLWAFNEEIVARAIASSRIPLISAVGHETDFTIADFVADLRAPTPSAAAELAVPIQAELLDTLEQYRHRFYQSIVKKLEHGRLFLRQWEGYFRDPVRRLSERLLRLDHIREQLMNRIHQLLQTAQESVIHLQRHLASLSPHAILKRGYAIVMRQGNLQPLCDTNQVQVGEAIEVQLFRGILEANVFSKKS